MLPVGPSSQQYKAMYKDVLRSIDYIEVFPLIGLAIFMGFFLGWVFYVSFLKKETVRRFESLPFEEGELQDAANRPSGFSAPR